MQKKIIKLDLTFIRNITEHNSFRTVHAFTQNSLYPTADFVQITCPQNTHPHAFCTKKQMRRKSIDRNPTFTKLYIFAYE